MSVPRVLNTLCLAALIVAGGAVTPVAAQTAGSTLVVTVMKGATPVAGAFVAVVGASANRYGGITNAEGKHTFSGIDTDTYTARASAPGTAVGSTPGIVVADGATVSATVSVTASSTIFSGLGAYGSATGTVVADGRSGIFYLNTTAIPSLYRTDDYGGTWAPVTISSDDAANGIDGSQTVTWVATSGYPGEVAASTRTKVFFSRDFGVTWTGITLPSGFAYQGARLYWGHPTVTNAPSVLIVESRDAVDGTLYAVDMTTASSTTSLTPMSASFKTNRNDRLWIANGSSRPVLAVAAASGGSVTLYALSAAPSATGDPKLTIANAAANAPTFVRIGGPSTGPAFSSGGTAPNTVIVYSDDTDAATTTTREADGRMTSWDATSSTWRTTTTVEFRQSESDAVDPAGSFNTGAATCGGFEQSIGAASPKGRVGTISSCWIEQSADFAKLVVRRVRGINNNTGLAFDSAYNGTTNSVIISGDGARGAAKSAQMDPTLNRPSFPAYPTVASPGTAATSGGSSINGLNSAVITDTALQPASRNNIAVVMAFAGGGRTVASADAGVTWFDLEAPQQRGGNAIDWWVGASGSQWILMGSGGGGGMLSAARLTSGAAFSTSTRTGPVPQTTSADLGLPRPADAPNIGAIAGVTGTDKAAVAAYSRPGISYTSAVLSLVTLPINSASPAAVSVITTGFAAGTAPVALAYCPPTSLGSAAVVADTLFVAIAASTQGGSDGGVYAVPGLTTDSSLSLNSTPFANTEGDVRDVRVHCASGTVWAGRYTAPGTSGLLKGTWSSTTPLTFSVVAVNNAAVDNIETLDVNPTRPNHVVAVTRTGDVVVTTNGGGSWSVLNRANTAGCDVSFTTCGRAFGDMPPGDIEIAPGPPSDRVPDVCPRGLCDNEALFGSSAGLYTATVSSSATGVPGAPTNLAASASGYTITLSWTAPATGAPVTEYLLEAALSSAFTAVIYGPQSLGSSAGATLSAPAGTTGTFFLRVTARNAEGVGPASNVVSVTLPGSGGGGAPGVPSAPRVVVNANDSINVSWNAPTSGATPTGYRVYVTTPAGPFPGSPFTLPATTAVASPGPLPSGSYTMTLTALAGSIEGAPSLATTFTVGCTSAPGAPTAFTITKTGGVGVRLAWGAPVSGSAPTSYRVQASLSSSFSALVFDAGVGNVTTIDAAGAPGTYFVRIVPSNACGNGAVSTTVSVTLP